MKKLITAYWMVLLSAMPAPAMAMHIAEGYLPQQQCYLWFAAAAPFIIWGIWRIEKIIKINPERKMLLGLAAAFIFVLSALKIPTAFGSSSHATGVGLSAVLFGPLVSSVLSFIVLLFQAYLLAHGGPSTLGANTFSMGIAGALTAAGLYRLVRIMGLNEKVAVFAAAMGADLITYAVTAGQLALGFPDAVSGFWGAYVKFISIFAFTQIPISIIEGLVSVVVYNSLMHFADQGIITNWWKEQRK